MRASRGGNRGGFIVPVETDERGQPFDARHPLVERVLVRAEAHVRGQHLGRLVEKPLVTLDHLFGQLAVGPAMRVGFVVGDELLRRLSQQHHVPELHRLLAAAAMRCIKQEQEGPRRGRRFQTIVWGMLTGDYSYIHVFRMLVSPITMSVAMKSGTLAVSWSILI